MRKCDFRCDYDANDINTSVLRIARAFAHSIYGVSAAYRTHARWLLYTVYRSINLLTFLLKYIIAALTCAPLHQIVYCLYTFVVYTITHNTVYNSCLPGNPALGSLGRHDNCTAVQLYNLTADLHNFTTQLQICTTA